MSDDEGPRGKGGKRGGKGGGKGGGGKGGDRKGGRHTSFAEVWLCVNVLLCCLLCMHIVFYTANPIVPSVKAPDVLQSSAPTPHPDSRLRPIGMGGVITYHGSII